MDEEHLLAAHFFETIAFALMKGANYLLDPIESDTEDSRHKHAEEELDDRSSIV